MSKHFRDHPQFKSYYGYVSGVRRETRTRLEPSAAIRDDTVEEPLPSGGRRVIPDGQRLEDIEAFEDPDTARYWDEHK